MFVTEGVFNEVKTQRDTAESERDRLIGERTEARAERDAAIARAEAAEARVRELEAMLIRAGRCLDDQIVEMQCGKEMCQPCDCVSCEIDAIATKRREGK